MAAADGAVIACMLSPCTGELGTGEKNANLICVMKFQILVSMETVHTRRIILIEWNVSAIPIGQD